MTTDARRGLYGKFTVIRNDGRSAPGEKHEKCEYFVLDLEHDKHARAALKAYAASCKRDYPELAKDLREKLKPQERPCGCRSVDHSCGRFFDPPRRPKFGRS
jgi:hypothetical protein